MRYVIFGLLLLTGCTDGQVADWASLSRPHHIRCYSGGQVIFDAYSTGKILQESSGGVFIFEDARTHSYVTTNADCIVTVEK